MFPKMSCPFRVDKTGFREEKVNLLCLHQAVHMQGYIEGLAAGEVCWFLCKVSPATFSALRVVIFGDDIYQV